MNVARVLLRSVVGSLAVALTLAPIAGFAAGLGALGGAILTLTDASPGCQYGRRKEHDGVIIDA